MDNKTNYRSYTKCNTPLSNLVKIYFSFPLPVYATKRFLGAERAIPEGEPMLTLTSLITLARSSIQL